MPDTEERTPTDVLSQIRDLLGVRGPLGDLSIEALRRYTRAQLLECATRAGLTGLSRLTKDAIAGRFQATLATLGAAAGRLAAQAGERAGNVARKFDLGRPAEQAAAPEHIPWAYGQDRITAVAIDPERLYVYWEATDEAIARARAQLGPGGFEAWLTLRVYDVSGRLFDGSNAHGYFDHRVERTDRQWFFDIGKPTATVVVELGLKSVEGYFARIARSGRADFPRRAPAPPAAVEWLTVRAATGAVAPSEPPDGGASVRRENGRTRIVDVQWQVTLHGPGARASPRVLAVWDLERSWVSDTGSARTAGAWGDVVRGASERRLGGASEQARGATPGR